MRDARAEHQGVEASQAQRRVMQRQRGRGARVRPVVPGSDIRAHRQQRARHGQAVAAQADDGIAAGREEGCRPGHRIFNVASPTRARIMETIQKRITMVGSDQPFFS